MIEPIARIRIELQEIEPKVWRRVDVPLSSTLLALHDFIQFAFRWTDSHLFEFEIGDRRYGQPEYDRYADERLYKASSIRLQTVVDRRVEQFLYVYDFGDNWRHDLFIEEDPGRRARRRLPGICCWRATGPSRRRGRHHRLHGVSRSEPGTRSTRSTRRWCAGTAGRFEPDDIDEQRVWMSFEMAAARRRGPLMSHRSGGRGRRT